MYIEQIGWGTPSDNKSLDLSTKNKNRIDNYQRKEKSPAALRAAIDIHKRNFPNAELRSITNTYNCYGMVFANRRTCINDDQLVKIFEGDEYASSTNWNNILPGDVVIYKDKKKNIQHVAIFLCKLIMDNITHKKLMVISKWGSDGEYVHEMNYIPYLYGAPVEYWTERKVL